MVSPDTAGHVANWDWNKGKRNVLASVAAKDTYLWQEEAYVSPDGETMTAIVRLEDESFTLRVNDAEWEETFEKAWNPRFAPDGRLTALVMSDDEWTVAVDGTAWEERYGFIWNTMFGAGGQIYASVQQDMQYGLTKDGAAWETLYENANEYSISPCGGKSAGVAQVKSLKAADVEGFRTGIYTVAVDGEAWEESFMNAWSPAFDPNSSRVAAQVRLNYYEYSIAVDGKVWDSTYNCVWAPAFNPKSGAIAAPVRQGGKWGMAIDGKIDWNPMYFQCWNQQWSADGNNLWAIVAPEYGKFTVACDNKTWNATFPTLSDLAISPDGTRAAALASHINNDFSVVVDGNAWQGSWDMAWKPVFSPDNAHVAALVRKAGGYTCMVDGKPVKEIFTRAWSPIFSPDSSSVLLRGIQDGALVRIVLPLSDI